MLHFRLGVDVSVFFFFILFSCCCCYCSRIGEHIDENEIPPHVTLDGVRMRATETHIHSATIALAHLQMLPFIIYCGLTCTTATKYQHFFAVVSVATTVLVALARLLVNYFFFLSRHFVMVTPHAALPLQ